MSDHRFILTLEPTAASRPDAVLRLRSLLKTARRLGLRCVRITQQGQGRPGLDQHGPDHGRFTITKWP